MMSIYEIVLIIHVILCVALVALVLLQQGKGAEIGAAFGGGASQTLFGSQGSGTFLSRATGLLAAAFFATSLTMGYIALRQSKATEEAVVTIPADGSESVVEEESNSLTGNGSGNNESDVPIIE